MKPIYRLHEFNSAKSTDLLPLKCEYCDKIFYRPKKEIKYRFKKNKNGIQFCSYKCSINYRNGEKEIVNCKQCDKKCLKSAFEIKKSPNHFCSLSCSARYHNTHKTTGNRRSKLEIWLEEQLTSLYPSLEIHYNKKTAIDSELDIYIPSLNLAFELNGIFHYEPIYGVDKLEQIKNNDASKSKSCHDAKIDLCLIDTSQQKYVKPLTSQKYLDIIINIIKERLLIS